MKKALHYFMAILSSACIGAAAVFLGTVIFSGLVAAMSIYGGITMEGAVFAMLLAAMSLLLGLMISDKVNDNCNNKNK